jgi:hypothetical protein
MGKKQSARLSLLATDYNPSQERIAKIKRWHIDQAVSEARPVATLNISITAAGEIVTQGVCIEQEHAQAFLAELQAVARRIKAQIRKPHPTLSLVRSA